MRYLIMILFLVLTACGQKGDLYLPDSGTVIDESAAQDAEKQQDKKEPTSGQGD